MQKHGFINNVTFKKLRYFFIKTFSLFRQLFAIKYSKTARLSRKCAFLIKKQLKIICKIFNEKLFYATIRVFIYDYNNKQVERQNEKEEIHNEC